MVSSCVQVVGSSALVGSIRKGVQPDEHTFNKQQEHALESTLEAALMLRFNQLKSKKSNLLLMSCMMLQQYYQGKEGVPSFLDSRFAWEKRSKTDTKTETQPQGLEDFHKAPTLIWDVEDDHSDMYRSNFAPKNSVSADRIL